MARWQDHERTLTAMRTESLHSQLDAAWDTAMAIDDWRVSSMASHFDVAERIENGIGADGRLHVHVAYHGGRLPVWLTEPIDEAARHAGELVPVTVFNVKDHSVDGAVCILSLCDLERLLHVATGAHGGVVWRSVNGKNGDG